MKPIRFLPFVIVISILSWNFQSQAQDAFKKERGKFVYLSSLSFAKGINEVQFEQRVVKNNIAVVSLSQVLAYKFNPYFFMGIGAGYDMWPKTGFIPLYASFNINILNGNWSPFIYFNTGYSFKWYVTQKPEPMTRVIHGSKAGAYGESGIGLNMRMSKKFSLLFSVNYKLQQTYINYSVIEGDQPDLSQISTNRSAFALYHFLGFRLGFLF